MDEYSGNVRRDGTKYPMTTIASSDLTLERLWQFSLQYYGVRGVKEASLLLQKNHHGNVNLLLLFKWLDEHQVTFTDSNWGKVQQAIVKSEKFLHPYRELRKKTKSHLPTPLYRELLEFELLLEKQQQSDLVDCIHSIELFDNHGEPLTLSYCRSLQAEHLYHVFADFSAHKHL